MRRTMRTACRRDSVRRPSFSAILIRIGATTRVIADPTPTINVRPANCTACCPPAIATTGPPAGTSDSAPPTNAEPRRPRLPSPPPCVAPRMLSPAPRSGPMFPKRAMLDSLLLLVVV